MVYDVVAQIFLSARKYKRENEVLRSLLRELGESDAAIRRKVRARISEKEEEDSALEMLTTVCQESLRQLSFHDLEDTPEKLETVVRPQ